MRLTILNCDIIIALNMKMKMKKTIYDEALKQFQTLQEMRYFDFSLENKNYSHNFLSKEPKHAVISSVELPKPELVIFFLERLLKLFNTLIKHMEQIENKEFELLYAYFNLILNEVDFFPELRNIDGHIKNKKYRKKVKDGFQIIKLRLRSKTLSFPEKTKLKNIKPTNHTLKVFEILDDFIDNFSDYNKIKVNSKVIFKESERLIKYGENQHPFQKERENNSAYKLLQSLWRYRQIISNDDREKTRGGQVRSKKQIALEMELTQYLGDYENKNNIKKSFGDTIKTLRRIFKEKKFPVKLKTIKKGQLLILVDYK